VPFNTETGPFKLKIVEPEPADVLTGVELPDLDEALVAKS
jgi:hypothetical protein